MFAQFQLSLCAIFRDEAPYFREWIEFHKLQGVEHFYLYNNNSRDNYQQTLQPYIDAGDVTLIDWLYEYESGHPTGWLTIQRNAYTDCLSNYGKSSDWLAFLDVDEFLFSQTGGLLTSILAKYEEYGGVCANWRLFGTSEIDNIPPGFLMVELLTQCTLVDHGRNRRVKSIVRPERVLACKNAHTFEYKGGFYAVDTDKNKMERPLSSEQVHYDQLQINHYWTRTKTEFINQKIKSRINRRSNETEELLWQRASAYNLDADFSILQFVPELKMRMGY
jgi:hypothetical protein